MEKSFSEHDVKLIFATAGKLLSAAECDSEKARIATEALSSFIDKTDTRLRTLENNVNLSINNSAEITANRAAELLSVKFYQADKAAEKVARQYQEAAEKLKTRSWVYFLGAQFAIVAIVSFLAVILVPSLDEIQQRRAELSDLNEQIKNASLEWNTCDTGHSREKCIRTDEREFSDKAFIDKDGKTWRIPWKEK